MPGIMHESTIDKLCAQQGFERNGFPKAYKSVMVHDSQDEMEDYLDEMMQQGLSKEEAFSDWKTVIKEEKKHHQPGFLPDAFKVDQEHKGIICVEVESTNPVNDRKMEIYVNAWFWLDCESWYLELHIYDRFGNLTAKLEDHDFCRMWHAQIEREARRAA